MVKKKKKKVKRKVAKYKTISVRMTIDQYIDLKDRSAEAGGIPMATYMKMKAFGR